ncbi:ribonuclease H-like domain-containing protein [Tanacetum coccineum]
MQSRDVAFWKEAINDEMDSIMENNTWILSDLPPSCKPLGCKWIFKRKMKVDGIIDKFKARLVIYDFKQKEGIDYFDTYAPVARISTIRLLIDLATTYNLVIHQMDVKTTFLNGDLEDEVYMKQPEGFIMLENEHKSPWGYQMGLESLEARIVIHEKNEAVYEEDIAFLKYDVPVKDIFIKDLKNQLEEALKEKDDLKLKLEKFEESSKNLTKLINSQISTKDKAGLGYDSQMNESEVVHSVFNSIESDVDNSLVSDSVYNDKVSETETSISKTSKDIVEKHKTVRPSAPIIEDWDTDSDDDSVFRPKSDQTKPKFTKINFVKSDENVKSVNKENTHKQVEYPRKSQSPRGFNHLIKDCDFHDNKMVEKPVLNNKGRVTGQREIRPVWNNVQRVNHQNKLTHPHPKRNFVPTAVATKLGQVPVNAAKQNSPRAAASISTARPVNTAAPKSKVNDALPKTYSYFKAHSPEVLKEVKLLEKKNSVLFTETKCLVLSPDFKLLDESQVLLKVPRQNNMYSFDLKNVVPSGGLTCLFAKATIDESNLWHRRLGHINFKNY